MARFPSQAAPLWPEGSPPFPGPQEDALSTAAPTVPDRAESGGKGFVRELGLLDSTMIVAGSMIGSGIFIVPADIARQVGSAGWLIAVWVVTGLMTVAA